MYSYSKALSLLLLIPVLVFLSTASAFCDPYEILARFLFRMDGVIRLLWNER